MALRIFNPEASASFETGPEQLLCNRWYVVASAVSMLGQATSLYAAPSEQDSASASVTDISAYRRTKILTTDSLSVAETNAAPTTIGSLPDQAALLEQIERLHQEKRPA